MVSKNYCCAGFVFAVMFCCSFQLNGMDLGYSRDLWEALCESAYTGDITGLQTILAVVPRNKRKDFVNQYYEGYGVTALHRAATAAVVRNLVSVGADLEARTTLGWTPLHYAVSKGNGDVVRELLRSNARCDVKNVYECTPWLLAITQGDSDVAQLIKSHRVQTKARRIAIPLAMSTHERLGNASPMSLLPQYLLGDIAQLSADAETYELESSETRSVLPPNYLNKKIVSFKIRINEIMTSRSAKIAIFQKGAISLMVLCALWCWFLGA